MKTLSLLWCALVLGAGFSSCTQVTVKEPFGATAAELDPDRWNGVWRMEDGDPGMITVSKDTPGEFTFSKVPDPNEASDEESELLTVAVEE